jgi:hypothetical protein
VFQYELFEVLGVIYAGTHIAGWTDIVLIVSHENQAIVSVDRIAGAGNADGKIRSLVYFDL